MYISSKRNLSAMFLIFCKLQEYLKKLCRENLSKDPALNKFYLQNFLKYSCSLQN